MAATKKLKAAGAASAPTFDGAATDVEPLFAREGLPKDSERADNAEASMLSDIDAILSRIEDGVVKEREALHLLSQRIKQPAA